MEQKQIYPITFIENVIDSSTKENLYSFLSVINHINVGYKKNAVSARRSVPMYLRKRGFYLTYFTTDDVLITEQFIVDFNAVDKEDADSMWTANDNWRQIEL